MEYISLYVLFVYLLDYKLQKGKKLVHFFFLIIYPVPSIVPGTNSGLNK